MMGSTVPSQTKSSRPETIDLRIFGLMLVMTALARHVRVADYSFRCLFQLQRLPVPAAKFAHQLSLGLSSSGMPSTLQHSEQSPHCLLLSVIGSPAAPPGCPIPVRHSGRVRESFFSAPARKIPSPRPAAPRKQGCA